MQPHSRASVRRGADEADARSYVRVGQPSWAIGACSSHPMGRTGGRPSLGEPPCRIHSENTYNTVALRCSLSSGVLMSLVRAALLGPAAIARYCLPLTAKVIGGAEKPEPTLTFHSSSSVVSSYAATVPSMSARKISPPPVASVPL